MVDGITQMKFAGHVRLPLISGSPALFTFIQEVLVALFKNSGTWKVPSTVLTPALVVTEETVNGGAAFFLSVLYA